MVSFIYEKNGSGNHKYSFGSYENFTVTIRKDYLDSDLLRTRGKAPATYFIEIGTDKICFPLWAEVYKDAPDTVRFYRTRKTLKDAKALADLLLNNITKKQLSETELQNYTRSIVRENDKQCDEWRDKGKVWNEPEIGQIAFF